MSEHETERTLVCVNARIAELTEQLTRAESERDRLLRELVDADGAHDRRPVAVR